MATRGLKQRSLAEALKKLPGAKPEQARELVERSSNVVFEQDGTVYRFAVGDWTADQFAKERQVLTALDGAMPCPVPQITNAGTDPAFLAYPMIPGRSLRDIGFHRLTREQQDRLLDQIAEFLATLHGQAPDRFELAGTDYGWNIIKKHIPSKLEELRDKDPSGTVHAFTEQTLDQEAQIRTRLQTTVPLHQDLQDSNILVDDDCVLAGVLDFTLFWIGDHHWDFRYIRSFAGDRGLMRLVARYQALGGHPVALDIVMVLERVTLCNAILWVGSDQQWKIDRTVAAMRAWRSLTDGAAR